VAGEHPRAGIEYPRNWHELLSWFPDDAACLRYLERLRWGDGFTCRFCGAVDAGWWQMATEPHPYKTLTSKSAA
jgi:hypothetical protein